MRHGWVITALLLTAAAAQATPGPVPDLRLTPSPSEHAIAVGALGATLEADYFRAPSRRISSGATCRLTFDPFEKERLAANCR
jgi:hypothetical protein